MLIDYCGICGKKNNNNTELFSITSHYFDNYIVCDNDECHVKHNEKIMTKEIEYKIFIKYSFKGYVEVNIPRSKGKHTIGKIMDRTEISDFLYLENGIPKLRVEFEDNGIQYTKYVQYNELSKCNLHLPIPYIEPYCKTNKLLCKKFYHIEKIMRNSCIYMNYATRLLLCAHYTKQGYLSNLPIEIIYYIIDKYYE